MGTSDNAILFIEHDDPEVTDKPHCDGCDEFEQAESRVAVTDKPHCDSCHT